jgi:TetR/AcrR family transcriptional regulator, transcriptional repressor for nem operon
MIDMMAEQMPDASGKTARKRAAATLATMMGTLVLSRIAGTGEFSDEILAAGREAALGRPQQAKAATKKSVTRKAAPTRQ